MYGEMRYTSISDIQCFILKGLSKVRRLNCVNLVLSRFQNMTFYSIFEQDGVGDVNSNAQATKYVEKVSKICKFWIT